MAEILVKSIRTDKEPRLVEVENIPKQSKTDKKPKEFKEDKRKYPRPRVWDPQMGLSLNNNPRNIKNGWKVK